MLLAGITLLAVAACGPDRSARDGGAPARFLERGGGLTGQFFRLRVDLEVLLADFRQVRGEVDRATLSLEDRRRLEAFAADTEAAFARPSSASPPWKTPGTGSNWKAITL